MRRNERAGRSAFVAIREYPRRFDGNLLIFSLLFLITVTPLFLGWLLGKGVGVQGDGVGYYAYLRSFFLDHDLSFQNEYEHYAAEGQKVAWLVAQDYRTDTGLARNHWPLGTAVLWAPFFLVGHGLALLGNLLGLPVSTDGYSAPYIAAISLGTAAYGFGGLVLSYLLARELFGRKAAAIATLGLWFASSLTAYLYFHTTLSHPSSFFMAALFLYLWYRTRQHRSWVAWAGLGLVGGLMILGRWQSAIYFIPLIGESLVELWLLARNGGWSAFPRYAAQRSLWGLMVFLAFLPQMVAWKVIYGYFLVDPLARFETRWRWTTPELWNVLFSSRHGLIAWTPIILLAILGLIFVARKDRLLGWGLGSTLLAQWYLVASWESWYAGSSFSNRYFIEASLIFVVGLSGLVAALSRRIALRYLLLGEGLFILWNTLLLYQFGMGLLPREEEFPWELLLYNQFFVVPSLLLQDAERVLRWIPPFYGIAMVALALLGALGSTWLWRHVRSSSMSP